MHQIKVFVDQQLFKGFGVIPDPDLHLGATVPPGQVENPLALALLPSRSDLLCGAHPHLEFVDTQQNAVVLALEDLQEAGRDDIGDAFDLFVDTGVLALQYLLKSDRHLELNIGRIEPHL